ncbi:MAG: LCP family protein [Candidatus Shapirobacteria bacterium]|jgi:anionic cell wall polymer biosynthesis LytR-Cps2A-Psr (LCP) family protein
MKLFKIITKIIFSIVFLIIFSVTIISSIISRSIGKSPNYLIETIYTSVKSNPYQSKDKINFLILGLDERNDALEKTTTTDTIIFASLNLKTFKLNLISTPRDLWFYEKEVKINNLYPLSLESGQDKFDFLKSNFKIIYGQPIDHIVVLTTNNLINFVNIIGGVDLYLEKGFIDDQYPNQEYIKNPSPSIPIYKTIEFPSGWIHLDSSNITEFVRSRKSAETAAQGGTDIGRIQRQQLLIDAILNKIKSGTFVNTTDQLKNLYFFWQNDISKTLSDTDALQIGLILNKNLKNISLNKIEIPIGTNNSNGVIYHPEKTNFTKQWIFTTNDDKYQGFHQFISEKIK